MCKEKKMRKVSELPVFAMGFRPFFLLGVLQLLVLMVFWIGGWAGLWQLPEHVNAIYWHSHEMLFGFGVAIVAGFLLTASANWTKTRGLHGENLLLLVGLWLLGRAGFWATALGASAAYGWLDLAFIPGVFLVLAPTLIRAKKWHNITFLFWLALLFIGHVLFLVDWTGAWAGLGREGMYLALDVVVLLMIQIGGRVIPFFTGRVFRDADIHKWVKVDRLALATVILYVFCAFFLGRLEPITGWVALAAGVLSIVRMKTWGSLLTWRKPIVWILHVAYLWLAFAYLLQAAACVYWVPLSVATHAFTAGAMGVFVLGMISRVSMGHTGRPIKASNIVTAAYVMILVAALARVVGPLISPGWYHNVISLSGTLWVLAYLFFFFWSLGSFFNRRSNFFFFFWSWHISK